MSIRLTILLCVLFLVSGRLIGQQELYDTWLDASQPDTVRLEALDGYSWGLINSEDLRDSGITLANKEAEYAKRIGNSKYLMLAQMSLGIAYFQSGEYDKSIDYYNQCRESAQLAGDEEGVLKARNGLALVYRQRGDHQNALKQFKSGLTTAESLKNKNLTAAFSSNMGVVYNDIGIYPEALQFHSKALGIYEELNDSVGMAKSSGNVAIVYHYLNKYDKALEMHSRSLSLLEKLPPSYELNQLKGSTYLHIAATYRELGDLQMSLTYLNKAEKTLIKVMDVSGLGSVYNSFGSVYQLMKDNDKALKYYKKALAKNDSIGDLRSVSISEIHIGQIENEKKNYKAAKTHCEKGLAIAQKDRGYVEVVDACACLYESTKNLNDEKNALYYFELSHLYTDSLEKEKAADKLHDEEIKRVIDAFNTDESTLEPEKLTEELDAGGMTTSKTLPYVLSLSLLLLGISAFVFFKKKGAKKPGASTEKTSHNRIPEMIRNAMLVNHAELSARSAVVLSNSKAKVISEFGHKMAKNNLSERGVYCIDLNVAEDCFILCESRTNVDSEMMVYSFLEEIKRQMELPDKDEREIEDMLLNMHHLSSKTLHFRVVKVN